MRPTSFALTFALASAVLAQDRRGRSFPASMDFGPAMTTTLQARGTGGTTYKALVVRLGHPEQGAGAVAFDTELLRLSEAWRDGWLQLRGTAYDGSHGPMPGARGREIAAVRPGPGWAFRGDFDDPRDIPFGPLAKERGAWHGYWLCGERVVVGYEVDGMSVREAYDLTVGQGHHLVRHFELGASEREQLMVVADAPEDLVAGTLEHNARQSARHSARDAGAAGSVVALRWQPVVASPVEIDVSPASFEELAMGAPSASDYLDRSSGTGAVVRFVSGLARPHGRKAPEDGAPEDDAARAMPRLHDGFVARDDDDRQRSVWFDKHKGEGDGRYYIDLQRAVEVSRVSTFSWHHGKRAQQDYELFASDAETPPALDAKDPEQAGWRSVARVRTGELGPGDRHGASVHGGLGACRHLLIVMRKGDTYLGEIDVYAGESGAAVDVRPRPPHEVRAVVVGAPEVELLVDGGRLLMKVPPRDAGLRFDLVVSAGVADGGAALAGFAAGFGAELAAGHRTAPAMDGWMRGGPKLWGEPVVTAGSLGEDDGSAYVVDTIAIPFDNPYGSRMRTGGFDFFSDGRAAITTWNGDVWLVDGIDGDLDEVRWTRHATGMFDPLGLRIVDDVIYVHGRDGITRLHDRDGNGEADFYECFNHDVMITSSFHEFAFDLQTDRAGNFYVSKGGPVKPGGRGFDEIVPHHGTILRISKDGGSLDVIATGLRAPNGIGVSPDGVVTSGDNEGSWIPRCRLNWITEPGYYGGVRDTAHMQDVPDRPDLPLCWMPMEIDNSSGSQVWVTSDKWGDLQGRLLHLSYGTCGLYLVLEEEVSGQVQGGVVRFPVSFSSSAMRARFHPVDQQLYIVGLQGWQTSAAREGGFHRVRYTGKPMRMPTALKTCDRGVYLTFDAPLDAEVAADPDSYGVEVWNYVYSKNYGSPEVSPAHPERKVERGKQNRDELAVHSVVLSADGRTVFLEIPSIQPVMQMRISYNLDDASGELVKGEVHNTIHALAPDPGMSGQR